MKKYLSHLILFITLFSLLFLGLLRNGEARMKVGDTCILGDEEIISCASQKTEDNQAVESIERLGSTFIIVHFSSFQLEEGDTVEIKDSSGITRETFDSSQSGAFWAPAVDGEEVTIILNSSPDRTSSFTIDSYGYGDPSLVESESVLESTCGSDDKTDRECHKGTYRYVNSGPVGRMYFQSGGSYGSWYVCTGSLLSHQNHFLTNNHCISTQAEADTLQVRWGYECTTCGGSTNKSYNTTIGSTLRWTNSGLDATLLTINSSTYNPALNRGYLPVSGRALRQGEAIYIPQHPAGNPKKIAATVENVFWSYVLTPVATENGYASSASFFHNADTVGGSSGSPVLDTQNRVIGLHHTGYGCPGGVTKNGAILMSKIFPYIDDYLPADVAQTASGSCSGCYGWRWAHAKEAWRYTSGAQERMWVYNRESRPYYMWTDTNADVLRTRMLTEAAASGHWLGSYWHTSSLFSNLRLWYY